MNQRAPCAHVSRRQNDRSWPCSKAKGIAIWGGPNANHGFVLLRMMEEEVCLKKRKGKETKIEAKNRKRINGLVEKSTGHHKFLQLNMGLS